MRVVCACQGVMTSAVSWAPPISVGARLRASSAAADSERASELGAARQRLSKLSAEAAELRATADHPQWLLKAPEIARLRHRFGSVRTLAMSTSRSAVRAVQCIVVGV